MPSPAPLSRLLAGAPLLLALAAGGCAGPADTTFPPPCPGLSLLKDAGDLTRFASVGGTHDVTDLAYAARITAVPASCANAGPNEVAVTLSVAAEFRRGLAFGRVAAGDTVPVPYFVALTDGAKVLNEQDFALPARFRPNVDSASARSGDIEIKLPVSKTRSAAAYHIYVGFRLTPEELAYNRRAQP